METYPGLQLTEPVFTPQHFQDGNSRNHQSVTAKRRVGNLTGLQRRVLPHSHKSQIKKISEVFSQQTYQFTALHFGLATAPLEFTKVVKEMKLMAQTRGIRIHQYLDDWLLRAPCQETCRQHTQTLLARNQNWLLSRISILLVNSWTW